MSDGTIVYDLSTVYERGMSANIPRGACSELRAGGHELNGSLDPLNGVDYLVRMNYLIRLELLSLLLFILDERTSANEMRRDDRRDG